MKMNLLKKITLLFLIGAGFFSKTVAQTCPSWGPYIESNLGGAGDEVQYAEVMAEAAGMQPSTYYSTLNFSLGPRGGYAGIQYKVNDVRNNIFSVWDLQDSNTPQCTAEYAAPNTLVDGFGGEGTGLHTDNPMPWKPGVWYATALRRWSIGDGKTRIGFFMYDYGTGIWKHYATIVTPENNAKLMGSKVGGFLENFMSSTNKQTRWGYYRNFRNMNSQGVWFGSNTYKISAGSGSWSATSAFNNTAVKVSTCGTTPPPSSDVIINLNSQNVKPSTTVPITVTSVTGSYEISNNSVNVRWATSDYTSPQLSYKVSLYSNESWNSGYTPIAVVNGIRPDQRSVSIPLPAGSTSIKYYVSVELKDIFNQSSNFGYNSFDLIRTDTYYNIKNVGSGQYITPKDFNASYENLVQQPLNGNPVQQWKFEKVGDNFVIVNRVSGKAIDIPGGNLNNGTSLIQYSKTNGNNQKWVVKQHAPGQYIFGSAMSNLKVMDNPANSTNPGTNVIIWDKNSPVANNQLWMLEEAEPVRTDRYYNIKNVGSGQYITPKDFNASSENLVQQPLNGNQVQQWKFEKAGNRYVIVNRVSGKAIDIPGGNLNNGTSLIQYSKTNGDNQKWIIKPYGSPGQYVLGSAMSNLKVMDNPANSTTPGTNIILWDQGLPTASNQIWVFEEVPNATAAKMANNSNMLVAKESKISLYPNPVKQGEDIHFDLTGLTDKASDLTLKVQDTNGFVVITKAVSSAKFSISSATLKPGVYFYSIEGNGDRKLGKFIVK